MRKPRIAACFLALTLALWAAHPVALADGLDWLTPESGPESGEAAPEPGEGPSAEQSGWLTGTESDTQAQSSGDEDSGSDWLTPGEAAPTEQDVQSAESEGWLTSMDVPEETPTEESDGWLTPDQAVEKAEEVPQSAKDDGWLTPDEAVGKKEEVPPPAREEGWLTPPDEAPAEEEKTPSPSEPESRDDRPTPDNPQTPDEPQKEAEPPVLMEVEEEKFWLTPNEQPEPEDEAKETRTVEETPEAGALIDVVVPKSGNLAINPRHQPVQVNGETVRDQIINEGQVLTNRSNVPIVVSASVTAATKGIGAWTITGEPIQETETAKQAYLYIEFQNLADKDSTAEWSGGYTGAANQLLVLDGETASGDVLRLEPGDEMPVYAAYRLFGSLTESPEDAWTDGDGLSVTIDFTFRPVEDAEPEESAPETQEKPEEAPAPEQEPSGEQAAESVPVSETAALPPDEPKPESVPSGTEDEPGSDTQTDEPGNETTTENSDVNVNSD